MTPEEITYHKEKIDSMSQIEMASLTRFAPAGHPYFNRYDHPELEKYFEEKFKEKGGMTSEISKEIGW